MTRPLVAVSIAAALGALAWACGTSPSRVVGLTLAGPTTATTGDRPHFTAATTGADGSRQDVTTGAQWSATQTAVMSSMTQPTGAVASSGVGQVVGADVIWSMPFDAYYGVVDGGILERLAPTRWLNIVGIVGGTLAGNTISATLTGEFDIYDTPTPVSTLVATLVPVITSKGTSPITLQQTNGVAATRRR